MVIGVWRPVPIMNAIYGLSNNPDARALEIKAYAIEWSVGSEIFDNRSRAKEILTMPFPEAGMMRHVSGSNNIGNVALIGYGALGSSIGDFLLRSGVRSLSITDPDVIEPHNFARHSATDHDLYSPKGKSAGRLNTLINSFLERSRVKWRPKRVQELDADDIDVLDLKKSFIIDATADERVRQYLSFKADFFELGLMRVEILDGGRLGAQTITGRGNNPDLNYLYSYLCYLGTKDKNVSDWLTRDSELHLGSEELLIGFSCASSSVIMPKERITLHAAAFLPKIRCAAGGIGVLPGVGVNAVSGHGYPLGWQWYDVPPCEVLTPSRAPDWTIRFRPEALQSMDQYRSEHAPKETGGYLYGTSNLADQVITVMEASPEPPGTVSERSTLELGPSGYTPLEKNISARCGLRLWLVGTWHSHPSSGPNMSAKDKRTISNPRTRDRASGIPTLLAITSRRGTKVHLFTD